MRCLCISNDRDVLVGMRLAGIDGDLALTAGETDEAITRAVEDEDVAVLIVTQGCYTQCRERLDTLKLGHGRPLVNVVPDSRGEGLPPDFITRLVGEAIGVKLDV